MTKVQITMTVEQAHILMRAMDFYKRMLIGQFDEIDKLFFLYQPNDPVFKRSKDRIIRDELKYHVKCIKEIIYPTLEYYSYFSVVDAPAPRDAIIINDMHESVDHAIAWYNNPDGNFMLNDCGTPMHWYKEVPLPEVKVFEE